MGAINVLSAEETHGVVQLPRVLPRDHVLTGTGIDAARMAPSDNKDKTKQKEEPDACPDSDQACNAKTATSHSRGHAIEGANAYRSAGSCPRGRSCPPRRSEVAHPQARAHRLPREFHASARPR